MRFGEQKTIDMLRHGISIPGITLIYLFSTLEPGIFFSLFNEKNKDLYSVFKKYGRRAVYYLPPLPLGHYAGHDRVSVSWMLLAWPSVLPNQGKETNETRKKPMAELRQETGANSTCIKNLGYTFMEIYECKWLKLT